MLKLFKRICIKVFKIFFRILPVKKNKIFFSNFFAQGYGDNPKYITEELLKRDNKIKIIWLLKNDKVDLDRRITKVKYPSIRAIYEYSTSKIIVQNIRNFHLNKKRKNQLYLQTWHGYGALKKVEGDAQKKLSLNYIEEAKYDGKITDAIIADSEFSVKMYRRCFWLNDKVEILKTGSPSFDPVINSIGNLKLIKILKEKKGVVNDYIVLYAPTFRDDKSVEGYISSFDEIIKSFKKITNKNVKIIVRFHPNVNDSIININYSENVIKSSFDEDIRELDLISDCVITDYSSVMCDFMLMKKPIFRYTADINNYKKIRGLYKEYFLYPFPISNNIDELCESITSFKYNHYRQELEKYMSQHVNYNNGEASKKAADWILNHIYEE